MLVLARHKDERIKIELSPETLAELTRRGGAILDIVVADIRGDKVRIGIEAPGCVPVHREEVFLSIHRAAQQQ